MVGRGFQPRRNHNTTKLRFDTIAADPECPPYHHTYQTRLGRPLYPDESEVGRDPPAAERKLERKDPDAVRLAIALERLCEEAPHKGLQGLRDKVT